MENENFAKITSEPSGNLQFGKGPVYRGKKPISRIAALLAAMGTILTLLPLALVSAPEKRPQHTAHPAPEVSPVSGGSPVHIENYSKEERKAGGTPKRAGTATIRYAGLQTISRPKAAKIPPGSIVKAILLTGASNGPVRAELKESLSIQGETLLSQGSSLIGEGQSAEERLFIRFSQVVYRDGTAEPVAAQALDSDGIAGLKGSKVGRYAMKLGAAIGLNFLGGMAEGFQQKEAVGQQVINKADARNALLNGASRASLELANETMANLKNQTPLIEVNAGTEILVLFAGR